MPSPLSSDCSLPRRHADFRTLTEAIDYAAGGGRGLNFYSGRGQLLEVLSYADLATQARSLARRMLRSGIAAGDRIALIAETDADFVRAFCACQFAGAIPVPLPLPMPFGGREGYIAHLRGMITAARSSGLLGPDALSSWIAEAAEGLGLRVVGSLAVFDGVAEDGVELPVISEDEVAYLQFSSGSTRFPMGVTVTHRALMANTRAIAVNGLAVRDGDRGVSWLPFYHDMGLVGFLLTPLASQVTIDFLPTREFARRPLTWLSVLAANGGTLSYSPSFGYELCARRAATASTDGLDLSRWRAAGIGGDMIRPHVLAGFAETFAPRGFDARAFVASYGMAEATLAVSFAPLDRGIETSRVDMDVLEEDGNVVPPGAATARSREFVLCGAPLPDHAVELRDPDGAVVPEGRVGRIFVRGPSMMRDYFDQPEETQRVLSADGWLDTGDLGYLAGGALVITGRAKDLIIVNGRNIWPQDLEWTAEQLDALRSGDAAAFSVDDGGDGEAVVLLVQCRLSNAEARTALKAAVAGAVRAEHGVEAEIVLVPPHSLPQTSSGKLSRARARRLYVEGRFADAA
ncbi:fatty acyl-AMP ligase [Azospirillum sp. SYSU D00513]|uniref:fatty acyl-AMP ligase n=1 Tax=Azospirillum sp. SYSU D00513 TaxID=2812561 RepID=UPI001A97B516|nr:fatty acyl-AMP ligase [Azospirillum sp. SYSU D00513]